MNLSNKKGFSLIEMLVTMAIFAIMVVMLLQSLLLNIRLSGVINARSQMRTEMDQVLGLIERDIRNADSIGDCGTVTTYVCELKQGGNNIIWELDTTSNPQKIIKLVNGGKVFETSSLIDYQFNPAPDTENETAPPDASDKSAWKGLDFKKNLEHTENSITYANIFVTLRANATNEDWRVNWYLFSLIRQISVSTRNFSLN